MSLFITEFAQEGTDFTGKTAPCALQQPLAEHQVATSSGSSAKSQALNGTTTIVRLHATEACSVLFGADPTATTASMRMASGQTEYFCVRQGCGLKIAAIGAS